MPINVNKRRALAQEFVDLVFPRMMAGHAESIQFELEGIRLLLQKSTDPRLMKDLEAKAKQLEKALLAETQAKVQAIMVDAMAGEFSVKELEELIHTEKLNIRVQGVAARLDRSLTELLDDPRKQQLIRPCGAEV